jgi:DNA relaxase NicK
VEITERVSKIRDESIGVGGFSGTIRVADASEREILLEHLEQYLGPAEIQPTGVRYYGRSALLGGNGSRVSWSPVGLQADQAHRRGEVLINVTQRDCDWLGFLRTRELARWLQQFGFNPTRVDLNHDDRGRVQGPRQVCQAFMGGRVVSRVRKCRMVESRTRVVANREPGTRDGETLYIGAMPGAGSEGSEMVLRIYDKDAEQGTPEGTYGYRWELQAREERARYLWLRVLIDTEDPGEAFAGVLTRFVDFRARREGQVNGDRSPRLRWWRKLVDQVERAQGSLAYRVDSLARRRAWVDAAWGKTLALLLTEAEGDLEWLRQLAIQAAPRVTMREWALVGCPGPSANRAVLGVRVP